MFGRDLSRCPRVFQSRCSSAAVPGSTSHAAETGGPPADHYQEKRGGLCPPRPVSGLLETEKSAMPNKILQHADCCCCCCSTAISTARQDKTIGRRCCRISGAVSAANYLEVPREARIAPLNLTGRFVYIQVRQD